MMQEITTFDEAYERYYPAIYHFFLKYYHHQQSAEDATQEVFCRAWRSWHTLKEVNFPWFQRIAKNLLTDQWRRTGIVEWCELSESMIDVIEDGSEDWQESELEMQLAASMQGLEAIYREALMLHLQGYGEREIAQRLHKTLSATKMLVYRAKRYAGAQWIAQEQEVA